MSTKPSVQTPVLPKNCHQALVAHACNPRYLGAEIRNIAIQSQPGQIVPESLSQKTLHQKIIGLVEWLKVKALSSSLSTTPKKKKMATIVNSCTNLLT
jgi:hypothetical protein